MKRGPTRHVFVAGDDVDPMTGTQFCEWCHLPAHNAVHDIPQRTDEQRDHEKRRTGERR